MKICVGGTFFIFVGENACRWDNFLKRIRLCCMLIRKLRVPMNIVKTSKLSILEIKTCGLGSRILVLFTAGKQNSKKEVDTQTYLPPLWEI